MTRIPLLTCAVVALAAAPTALAESGPQLWGRAGCGGCHTLAAAGATGDGGPNLDQLRPSQAAVAAQVASGGGGMPSFAGTLSSGEIQTLAAWVAASAGSTGAVRATAGASGMTVTAVRKLQHELHTLGYFSGPYTGYYGPLTTAAVRRFQRASGLKADGVWGPKSEAALRRRLRG